MDWMFIAVKVLYQILIGTPSDWHICMDPKVNHPWPNREVGTVSAMEGGIKVFQQDLYCSKFPTDHIHGNP